MSESDSENPAIVGEVPVLSQEETETEHGKDGAPLSDVSILTQQMLAQNLHPGPGVEIHEGGSEASEEGDPTEEQPPASVRPDPKLTNRPPTTEDMADIINLFRGGLGKAGIPREAQPENSETSAGGEPAAPTEVVTCTEGDEE